MHTVPGPSRRGTTSRQESTTTAANIANAAHFETTKWGSILLLLSTVLGTSSAEEYLPSTLACGAVRDVVVTALFLVLELFFELTRREFSESCLDALETNLVPVALDALHQLFCIRQHVSDSTNDFRGTKLHLVMHFPYFIRKYGAPLNWDTSAFETAHKHLVKAYYRKGSKRTATLTRDIMAAVSDTNTCTSFLHRSGTHQSCCD